MSLRAYAPLLAASLFGAALLSACASSVPGPVDGGAEAAAPGPSPDAAPPDAPMLPDAAREAAVLPAPDASPAADAAIPDAADAASQPVDAEPPDNFRRIYAEVLESRCPRCHVSGSTSGSRLAMPDAPTAYANLLNVRVLTDWARYCGPSSGGTPTYDRVRPRDPDNSMMGWLPTCYVRDAMHTLSDAEVARVRRWISAGAPY